MDRSDDRKNDSRTEGCQCLVIGYVGMVITPEILKRIRNVHPAGIRVGMTMRVKTALHDPYAYNQDCVHRVLRQPKDTVKDSMKTVFCTYGVVPECLDAAAKIIYGH